MESTTSNSGTAGASIVPVAPAALVLCSTLSRSSLFCLVVVALEEPGKCTCGTPGGTPHAHGGLAVSVRGSNKKYPKRVREILMSNLCFLVLASV